jgi:anion-transporting  ArsA/GET3 family ATPase
LIPDALLQERIRGVKALFRDKSQTEFIIATIPTQLGINESRRLLGTLREEGIPCKRVIVNQVRRQCCTSTRISVESAFVVVAWQSDGCCRRASSVPVLS